MRTVWVQLKKRWDFRRDFEGFPVKFRDYRFRYSVCLTRAEILYVHYVDVLDAARKPTETHGKPMRRWTMEPQLTTDLGPSEVARETG